MKYRSFSQEEAQAIHLEIKNGGRPNLEKFGRDIGDELLIDLQPLLDMNRVAVGRCSSGVSKELVELEMSGNVYEYLKFVPVDIRDDAGFWRWITVAAFLDFLKVRQGDALKEAIGAGTNKADILACRMFLRAQVVKRVLSDGSNNFSGLTTLGTEKHDFLQSCIVRVTTGGEVNLAVALINDQTRSWLKTEPVRQFVKDHITRPRMTLATCLMTQTESEKYIAEQRNKFIA